MKNQEPFNLFRVELYNFLYLDSFELIYQFLKFKYFLHQKIKWFLFFFSRFSQFVLGSLLAKSRPIKVSINNRISVFGFFFNQVKSAFSRMFQL